MKKNILAIAIATAVAAPVAMADTKIYGQFNMAVDMISDNVTNAAAGAAADKDMNVVSRNSRIGFKGAEDLGNGLKAIYQMEGTVDVAGNGSDSVLNVNRNTFVGLGGNFGTVVMGRHDTPLRMIQPSDGFADSAFASNNRSNFNGGLAGEDRLDEVIAYLSPDFNGIKFAAALSGQDNMAEGSKDQALTNAMSFNLTYGSKKSGIFAAAGLTSTGKSGSPAVERGDIIRATVQYNEAGLLVSGMVNSQDNKTIGGTSVTLGGAYKLGAITPRAKLSMITYEASGAKDSMNMAVGVDYALGKSSRVYAEYAMLDKENRAITTAPAGKDLSVFSVGLFHKF